jgi:hypothetical protein
MNAQEVLGHLEVLESKLEKEQSRTSVQAPPSILLEQHFGVCPQSLVCMDSSNLMALQSNCEKYHATPFESSWLKNPNIVIQAFDAIQDGSSLWQRFSFESDENKGSSQTSPDLKINRK